MREIRALVGIAHHHQIIAERHIHQHFIGFAVHIKKMGFGCGIARCGRHEFLAHLVAV